MMVFLWPSHLFLRNVKTPVPVNPTELNHNQNKADGFCVNQVVQKNRSSFVPSSDLPGPLPTRCRRQGAHSPGTGQAQTPPPQLPGSSVQPAVCRADAPRAPHPSPRQSLSKRSSRLGCVPYGALSPPSLLTSFAPLGRSSEKTSRKRLHPHVACLREQGSAVTAPGLQRELQDFLLPPYTTGKD